MRRQRRNRPVAVALITAALLLVFAALTAGTRRTRSVDSIFFTALSPIRELSENASNAVSAWLERVFLPNNIQKENEALRLELALAKKQLFLMDEISRENARLTELLNYSGGIAEAEFVAAAVISRSSDAFSETITVAAGSRQGIVRDAAVICPDGIVGRVYEVGLNFCRIRTVQSDNLVVPVIVERTRDGGMLNGIVYSQSKRIGIGFVRIEAGNGELSALRIGDRLITSGEDGAFPKGLPAGVILIIAPQDQEKVYDACVISAVDFTHLEEVLIVVRTP